MDIRELLHKTASDLEEMANFLDKLELQNIQMKAKSAGMTQEVVNDIINNYSDDPQSALNLAIESLNANKQASIGTPLDYSEADMYFSATGVMHDYDRMLLNGG